MKMFMGVDPGSNGGMVMLNIDGALLSDCRFCRWTESEISDILETIKQSLTEQDTLKCYIEKVHSRPARDKNGKTVQGQVSTFKFGDNNGFIRGLLVAHKIPFDYVTPQKWQKAIGCIAKGDKKILQQKAQELFPNYKITQDIADAYLIAEYARRTGV